jgi:CBS domain-containing protein
MGAPPVVVTSTASFQELVALMVEHRIGCLPVVDGGILVGIVTEADLVPKEGFGGHHRSVLEVLVDVVKGGHASWTAKASALTARAVMSRSVDTVPPVQDLRRAVRRMVEVDRSHLVVVDDGTVVGVLSRSDVLRGLHASDDDLRAAAADLLADPFVVPEDHAVEIDVDGGIITMRGTVRTAADLPLLISAMWRLPAVVDVVVEVTARDADLQV